MQGKQGKDDKPKSNQPIQPAAALKSTPASTEPSGDKAEKGQKPQQDPATTNPPSTADASPMELQDVDSDGFQLPKRRGRSHSTSSSSRRSSSPPAVEPPLPAPIPQTPFTRKPGLRPRARAPPSKFPRDSCSPRSKLHGRPTNLCFGPGTGIPSPCRWSDQAACAHQPIIAARQPPPYQPKSTTPPPTLPPPACSWNQYHLGECQDSANSRKSQDSTGTSAP